MFVFKSLVSFTCAVGVFIAFHLVNILIYTHAFCVNAANSCLGKTKQLHISFEHIVMKAGTNLEPVTVSGCGTKQEILTSNS